MSSQPAVTDNIDRTRLAPDDAVASRTTTAPSSIDTSGPETNNISVGKGQAFRNVTGSHRPREDRHKDTHRSRRKKGTWKKLLWIRQSYPDNYTDEATFLDALQRNPRLRPYEFWPLVADSTVIVQQFCTVIVFVCCFHGIIHDRVSPVTVVSWGSFGTVLGWLLWDSWVGHELAQNAAVEVTGNPDVGPFPISRSVSHKDLHSFAAHQQLHQLPRSTSQKDLHGHGVGTATGSAPSLRSLSQMDLHSLGSHSSRPSSQASLHGIGHHGHNHSRKTSSSFKLTPISEPPHSEPLHGRTQYNIHHYPSSTLTTPTQSPTSTNKPPLISSVSSPHIFTNSSLLHLYSATSSPTSPESHQSYTYYPPLGDPSSRLTPRNQQRLATAKSAVLIYFALLGLSPILKSLTRSTASDSIWAIAFWLMFLNLISFDYSSGDVSGISGGNGNGNSNGPGASTGGTIPSSLSTNAALMASTVLASRLPSTTHVFSLTLFSIEVFGLFPVFRRYLRHISWVGHLWLTSGLVMAAGGGVAMCVSGGGMLKAGITGAVIGSLCTGLVMGMCSWWLIGLQRFKNEIYGPWDPARPIIRRWD